MGMEWINNLLYEYLKSKSEENKLYGEFTNAQENTRNKYNKVNEYMDEEPRKEIKEFVARVDSFYYLVKMNKAGPEDKKYTVFDMELIDMYTDGDS